jgi:predicted transcriptional regulator
LFHRAFEPGNGGFAFRIARSLALHFLARVCERSFFREPRQSIELDVLHRAVGEADISAVGLTKVDVGEVTVHEGAGAWRDLLTVKAQSPNEHSLKMTPLNEHLNHFTRA